MTPRVVDATRGGRGMWVRGVEVKKFRCFSDFVRALRRRYRLSQRAMARALDVSSGYVGQWELSISQPSPEVAAKMCKIFDIDDIEYVQRLAYAQRAPDWLRESIIQVGRDARTGAADSPTLQRIVDVLRGVPEDKMVRLAERIEGWVEGLEDCERPSKPPPPPPAGSSRWLRREAELQGEAKV